MHNEIGVMHFPNANLQHHQHTSLLSTTHLDSVTINYLLLASVYSSVNRQMTQINPLIQLA